MAERYRYNEQSGDIEVWHEDEFEDDYGYELKEEILRGQQEFAAPMAEKYELAKGSLMSHAHEAENWLVKNCGNETEVKQKLAEMKYDYDYSDAYDSTDKYNRSMVKYATQIFERIVNMGYKGDEPEFIKAQKAAPQKKVPEGYQGTYAKNRDGTSTLVMATREIDIGEKPNAANFDAERAKAREKLKAETLALAADIEKRMRADGLNEEADTIAKVSASVEKVKFGEHERKPTEDFFKAYEEALAKLSPQQQKVVTQILDNLEHNNSLVWRKGWDVSNLRDSYGAPQNPITGTVYSGVNAFYLASQGYPDPRWVTFNQMQEKGYRFRTGANGESLAKGRGAQVEFFSAWDKLTKQPFDKNDPRFASLSSEKQREYIQENVSFPRKTYTVFNASLIDGFEPWKVTEEDKRHRNEVMTRIMENSEAPISPDGGNQAYYNLHTDSIHLPPIKAFGTIEEYYGVALHEIGHSTGHHTRLNRDLSGGMGSESYAQEELRAEFSSALMAITYGVQLSVEHIENHAAYIQSWAHRIRENPQTLISAIKDAWKIASYIDGRARTQATNEPVSTQKENVSEKSEKQTVVESNSWSVLGSMESHLLLEAQGKKDLFCVFKGSSEDALEYWRTDNMRAQGVKIRAHTKEDWTANEKHFSFFPNESEARRAWLSAVKESIEHRLTAYSLPQGAPNRPNTLSWHTRTIDEYFCNIPNEPEKSTLARDTVKLKKLSALMTGAAIPMVDQAESLPTAEKLGKKTLYVNLFAGPGAGKTTAAMEICAELKKQGINAEYVQEYAKELVLTNDLATLKDQEKVTKEQIRRQRIYDGKVDVVVTDSPILLGKIYGTNNSAQLNTFISDTFKEFANFNLFILRGEDYDTRGRLQNKEQALQKDKEILAMLKEHNLYFGSYERGKRELIASNILRTLERINDGGKQGEPSKAMPTSSTPLGSKEAAAPKAVAEAAEPARSNEPLWKQAKRAKTLSNIEANIPQEMKKLPNWCAFKATYIPAHKDEKTGNMVEAAWVKKPWNCNPLEPKEQPYAKCNDSATWATFDKALAFAKANDCDGLSFALTKESGIFCIDLDKVMPVDSAGKPTGKYKEIVWEVANVAKGTYTERSVSGKGIHFFGLKGSDAEAHAAFNGTRGNKSADGTFELYDSNRFMSVTGDLFGKSTQKALVTFTASNSLLEVAKNQLSERTVAVMPKRESSYPASQTASDVIARIRASRSASEFDSLYSGTVMHRKADGSPDQSKSDLRLCSIAAAFSGCDRSVTHEIFTSSGLYRGRNQGKGDKYIDRTVEYALSHTKPLSAPTANPKGKSGAGRG